MKTEATPSFVLFKKAIKAFDAVSYKRELEDTFGDRKASEVFFYLKKTQIGFQEVSVDICSDKIHRIPTAIKKALQNVKEEAIEANSQAAQKALQKIAKQLEKLFPTPKQEFLAQVKENDDSNHFCAMIRAIEKMNPTNEDFEGEWEVIEKSSRLSEYVSPTSGIYSSTIYKTYEVKINGKSTEVEITTKEDSYRI